MAGEIVHWDAERIARMRAIAGEYVPPRHGPDPSVLVRVDDIVAIVSALDAAELETRQVRAAAQLVDQEAQRQIQARLAAEKERDQARAARAIDLRALERLRAAVRRIEPEELAGRLVVVAQCPPPCGAPIYGPQSAPTGAVAGGQRFVFARVCGCDNFAARFDALGGGDSGC